MPFLETLRKFRENHDIIRQQDIIDRMISDGRLTSENQRGDTLQSLVEAKPIINEPSPNQETQLTQLTQPTQLVQPAQPAQPVQPAQTFPVLAEHATPQTWKQELNAFVDSDQYKALQGAARILANWNNPKRAEVLLTAEKQEAEARERRAKERQTQAERQTIMQALMQQGVDPTTARAASMNQTFLGQTMMGRREVEKHIRSRGGQLVEQTDTYIDGTPYTRYVPLPNTKEYKKRYDENESSLKQLTYRAQFTTRVINMVDNLSHFMRTKPLTSGVVAQYLSKFWGTNAADVEAMIDNIEGSNIVNIAAQLRRDYGSIFGQLTEKESTYLASVIGLVKAKLSHEEKLQALAKLKNDMTQGLDDMISVELPNAHFNLFRNDMLSDRALVTLLHQAEDALNVTGYERGGKYEEYVPLSRNYPVYRLTEEQVSQKWLKERGIIPFITPDTYKLWRQRKQSSELPPVMKWDETAQRKYEAAKAGNRRK